MRPDQLQPGGAVWPGAAATIPAPSWPGSGPGGNHGSRVVRPYAAQRHGGPAQPANSANSADPPSSANTPPYGDAYGYGHQPGPGRTVSPGDDPRRPDGQWGNGRPAGNGTWGARPAYPPVNGYSGPYDPRGNDRPLSMRSPRAH